jgi:hypothetical protein
VHAPSEEKSDDSKDCFYEEMEEVFDLFPNYHTEILLRDFNVKLGREDIFKPAIGNESLHQGSSGTGVRIINSATSKYLVVNSIMLRHRKLHDYTLTSPDAKTHNQVDNILIDKK